VEIEPEKEPISHLAENFAPSVPDTWIMSVSPVQRSAPFAQPVKIRTARNAAITTEAEAAALLNGNRFMLTKRANSAYLIWYEPSSSFTRCASWQDLQFFITPWASCFALSQLAAFAEAAKVPAAVADS
jgi:hypothetical protein